MNAKVLVASLVIAMAMIGIGAAVTPVSKDITFDTNGWHTISTPFDLDVDKTVVASTPFDGISSGVWWDGDSWEKVSETSPSTATSAAYVYVSDYTKAKITLVESTEQVSPLAPGSTVNLGQGVHFVGISPNKNPPPEGGWNPETLTIGATFDGTWEAIINPASNGNGWVLFYGQLIPESLQLKPYVGYWIVLDAGDTAGINKWWV